jgi:hypothetical protein
MPFDRSAHPWLSIARQPQSCETSSRSFRTASPFSHCQVERMKLKQAIRFGIVAAGLLAPIGSARSQNADTVTPPEVLADQLRGQGYPCARALSSQRDGDKSNRDESVWILKCTNGIYRVRLIPDMAAKVEKID